MPSLSATAKPFQPSVSQTPSIDHPDTHACAAAVTTLQRIQLHRTRRGEEAKAARGEDGFLNKEIKQANNRLTTATARMTKRSAEQTRRIDQFKTQLSELERQIQHGCDAYQQRLKQTKKKHDELRGAAGLANDQVKRLSEKIAQNRPALRRLNQQMETLNADLTRTTADLQKAHEALRQIPKQTEACQALSDELKNWQSLSEWPNKLIDELLKQTKVAAPLHAALAEELNGIQFRAKVAQQVSEALRRALTAAEANPSVDLNDRLLKLMRDTADDLRNVEVARPTTMLELLLSVAIPAITLYAIPQMLNQMLNFQQRITALENEWMPVQDELMLEFNRFTPNLPAADVSWISQLGTEVNDRISNIAEVLKNAVQSTSGDLGSIQARINELAKNTKEDAWGADYSSEYGLNKLRIDPARQGLHDWFMTALKRCSTVLAETGNLLAQHRKLDQMNKFRSMIPGIDSFAALGVIVGAVLAFRLRNQERWQRLPIKKLEAAAARVMPQQSNRLLAQLSVNSLKSSLEDHEAVLSGCTNGITQFKSRLNTPSRLISRAKLPEWIKDLASQLDLAHSSQQTRRGNFEQRINTNEHAVNQLTAQKIELEEQIEPAQRELQTLENNLTFATDELTASEGLIKRNAAEQEKIQHEQTQDRTLIQSSNAQKVTKENLSDAEAKLREIQTEWQLTADMIEQQIAVISEQLPAIRERIDNDRFNENDLVEIDRIYQQLIKPHVSQQAFDRVISRHVGIDAEQLIRRIKGENFTNAMGQSEWAPTNRASSYQSILDCLMATVDIVNHLYDPLDAENTLIVNHQRPVGEMATEDDKRIAMHSRVTIDTASNGERKVAHFYPFARN